MGTRNPLRSDDPGNRRSVSIEEFVWVEIEAFHFAAEFHSISFDWFRSGLISNADKWRRVWGRKSIWRTSDEKR